MTDNASNNTTFMKVLGELYAKRQPEVSFDARNSHVFCFPHVINIIAQRMINALDNRVFPDDDDKDEADDDEDDEDDEGSGGGIAGGLDDNNHDSGDDNSDIDGVVDDSSAIPDVPLGVITKVCKLVRTIRASGQRQDVLRRVIQMGNQGGLWLDEQGNPMTIALRQLILDVPTRWDSTHQMLIRFVEFRHVRNFVFRLRIILTKK